MAIIHSNLMLMIRARMLDKNLFIQTELVKCSHRSKTDSLRTRFKKLQRDNDMYRVKYIWHCET